MRNPLSVERLGEIYSRTAAFYDGIVAEKQAAAKRLALDMLGRKPGERCLEVGTGTGWVLQRLIAESGAANVYGLDVAEGMLAVARDTLVRVSDSLPVLLLGDGRALPFPDASIDCIVCTYTLEVMGLEDITATLADILRVLRAGGRAVIVNLTDRTEGGPEDEAMIADWKARYESDPEAFGGARPLQMKQLLLAHGFVSVVRSYIGPDWPSEVLLAVRPGGG